MENFNIRPTPVLCGGAESRILNFGRRPLILILAVHIVGYQLLF